MDVLQSVEVTEESVDAHADDAMFPLVHAQFPKVINTFGNNVKSCHPLEFDGNDEVTNDPDTAPVEEMSLPLIHAQFPKVINTFGKRTGGCTDRSGPNACEGQLELLVAMRSIQDMQSSLENQLKRRHGELLELLQSGQSVRIPTLPAPQSLRSVGCSDETPSPLSSALAGRTETKEFGMLAGRTETRELGLTATRSNALEGSINQSQKPPLLRRNTNEYCQAALRRANLHEVGGPKTSVLSSLPWNPISMSPIEVKKRFRRSAAARLLRWNGFDTAIGFVILLNSICIGWEINLSTSGQMHSSTEFALKVLELLFLWVYASELGLRFYVDGRGALKNRWVVFDCVLVSSGTFGTVVRNVVALSADQAVQEANKQIMLLRVIRLLRLVRALRLVRQFKTLWRLVNGLLTALDTMLSTLALIALVLYVASCIGVELITGNEALLENPDLARLIETEYNSVPTTMMSLMQFVTMDDLADLYKPIIREQPLTSVYFVSILMIVSIALLNLVTAVLVEGALEKSRKDHEMEAVTLRRQVKSYLPLARDLFRRMDTDGSGMLTLSEIVQKIEDDDDHELRVKLQEIVPFESIIELFESLDIDGDGVIPEQEFVDGVLKALTAGNAELGQILRLLRIQGRKLERLEAQAQGGFSELKTLPSNMNMTHAAQVWCPNGSIPGSNVDPVVHSVWT